jgi:hypothetical protein
VRPSAPPDPAAPRHHGIISTGNLNRSIEVALPFGELAKDTAGFGLVRLLAAVTGVVQRLLPLLSSIIIVRPSVAYGVR